jgi:hypothetical protein
MKKISGQIFLIFAKSLPRKLLMKTILVENFLVDNCLAENVLIEKIFLMQNHFPGNSSDEKKIWRIFFGRNVFWSKLFYCCKISLQKQFG